jgi:hypothetical protein
MNTRYLGLDFARAILMLLGIFYHSSLIYINDGQWHVSHSQHSQLFNAYLSGMHEENAAMSSFEYISNGQ